MPPNLSKNKPRDSFLRLPPVTMEFAGVNSPLIMALLEVNDELFRIEGPDPDPDPGAKLKLLLDMDCGDEEGVLCSA